MKLWKLIYRIYAIYKQKYCVLYTEQDYSPCIFRFWHLLILDDKNLPKSLIS